MEMTEIITSFWVPSKKFNLKTQERLIKMNWVSLWQHCCCFGAKCHKPNWREPRQSKEASQ